MAFGSTTVLFGEGLTWDALVKQSALSERTAPLDCQHASKPPIIRVECL
jgi:hypothetical protein